ncbi:MAG: acyl-CoA dehydrogenase C-terminal domain-containing protein, partial [Burkholderiaceae bacterium]
VKTAPNNVFAGSVLYLKLAGLVVSAWHSARAALAAQAQLDAGNNDTVFLNSKVQTSAFYIQALLPQAQALTQAILHAGEGAGHFDVAQF